MISFSECKNSSTSEQAVVTNKDTAKLEFFPVTSFIKAQLMLLDSMKVTPLKIAVKNGKEDSAWIKIAELKKSLEDFTSFEINTNNLSDFFSEAKFNDESTEAITFTYTPKGPLPDSIAVKHWDVYINPANGRVKRIYVVKQLVQNGINYIQQLTWQTDKWARITTIQNLDGGVSKIVSDTKIIWDF